MEHGAVRAALNTESIGVPPPPGEAARGQIKLLNVQILRAYAAFAVVFFHTGFGGRWPHNVGRAGVDTFFVISGFIMAYICATNPQNFLLRRVARIVPLYWVATLCVFALSWFAPSLVKATRPDFGELIKSLFFIPFFKSNGLFQPTLFVGWSINDEMYFYIVIAIALLVVRRHAAAMTFGAILAIFLALRVFQFESAAAILYSRPDILAFLLGILCFWIFESVPTTLTQRFRQGLVIVAIVAIALQIYIEMVAPQSTRAEASHYQLTPPSWAFGQIALLIVAMVIVLCAVLLDRIGFSPKWSFIILLGDASYATYLVHFYCVQAIALAGGHVSHFLLPTTIPGLLVSLVAAHAAGLAVYLYVDKPAHTRFRHILERNMFSNEPRSRSVNR